MIFIESGMPTMLFEHMGFDILNTCLICDMSSSSQDDIGKSMALAVTAAVSPSPFIKLDQQDDIDTGTDTEENTHTDSARDIAVGRRHVIISMST